MKIPTVLISIILCIISLDAKSAINFESKKVQSINQSMLRGEIQVIKFDNAVSELHFINEDQKIVKIERSPASKNGYYEFLIKALSEGSTVINFKVKDELISLNIQVNPNYKILEEELNNLQ